MGKYFTPLKPSATTAAPHIHESLTFFCCGFCRYEAPTKQGLWSHLHLCHKDKVRELKIKRSQLQRGLNFAPSSSTDPLGLETLDAPAASPPPVRRNLAAQLNDESKLAKPPVTAEDVCDKLSRQDVPNDTKPVEMLQARITVSYDDDDLFDIALRDQFPELDGQDVQELLEQTKARAMDTPEVSPRKPTPEKSSSLPKKSPREDVHEMEVQSEVGLICEVVLPKDLDRKKI